MITADDVLARIGNVTPLEAAFIAAMENGEIGPDGDVIELDEDNPPPEE